MRLTRYDRSAFVLSVMKDIPVVDYQKQFADVIRADMLVVAPMVVRALLKDKKYSHLLFGGNNYTYLARFDLCKKVQNSFPVATYLGYEPSAEAVAKIQDIHDKWAEQAEKHCDMETKVRSVIASCLTRKDVQRLLPEFEKYLAPEPLKTAQSMLPVVANLAAELILMGWPKDAS